MPTIRPGGSPSGGGFGLARRQGGIREVVGARRERAFTLIEVLVVMIIVAILAMVAIPVFLRQQEKGYQNQITAALKTASIAVETYAAENDEDYSGLDGSDGSELEPYAFDVDDWPFLSDFSIEADAEGYCLQAEHANASGSSEWKQATFLSTAGAPSGDPDTCPSL